MDASQGRSQAEVPRSIVPTSHQLSKTIRVTRPLAVFAYLCVIVQRSQDWFSCYAV